MLSGAVMKAARDFKELLVWQIADALRVEILNVTKRPEVACLYKFRAQIEDAVDSVCRNIAEGFAADTNGQFAAYLRVSRRSLNELRDACRSAEEKKLITVAESIELRRLMARLRPPLDAFIAHLERTAARRIHRARRSSRDQDDDGFYYTIK